MWENAQRDGRPAEYRWRPLPNAADWLTPTTRMPCSNAAKMRNPLKFAEVNQTRQQISAASIGVNICKAPRLEPPSHFLKSKAFQLLCPHTFCQMELLAYYEAVFHV